MSGKDLQALEEIWHGIEMPYTELFAWLDGKAERPDVDHASRFHPLMLSNPIDEVKDLAVLDPAEFSAEWKWDGIRVQLILGTGQGVAVLAHRRRHRRGVSPTWWRMCSAKRCSTASCWSAGISSRHRSTICSSG